MVIGRGEAGSEEALPEGGYPRRVSGVGLNQTWNPFKGGVET